MQHIQLFPSKIFFFIFIYGKFNRSLSFTPDISKYAMNKPWGPEIRGNLKICFSEKYWILKNLEIQLMQRLFEYKYIIIYPQLQGKKLINKKLGSWFMPFVVVHFLPAENCDLWPLVFGQLCSARNCVMFERCYFWDHSLKFHWQTPVSSLYELF